MALVAGQILHAGDLAALSLSSRLDADSASVNNSIALVSSSLTIPLAANSVYRFDTFIAYDTSAAADLRWGMLCPASTTGTASLWGSGLTAATTDATIFHDVFTWTGNLAGGSIGGVASGTIMSARIVGTLRTSSTAGSITFQYAQWVATAVNTFLKKDSWMIAQAI